MLDKVKRRLNLSRSIILLYLGSVVILSIYPTKNWETLTFGLILASFGTTITFLLLRHWETSIGQISPSLATTNLETPSLPQTQDNPFTSTSNFQDLETAATESRIKAEELSQELSLKEEEIHRLTTELEQSTHKTEDIIHEYESLKSNSEEEVRRKTVLLSEYQETINQQRDVIEKKQTQISELESKVRDLNYEVKTLLQLTEINQNTSQTSKGQLIGEESTTYEATPPPPSTHQHRRKKDLVVKSPEDASHQLNRCIDIAQKVTGANHFGNGNSRFRDMPINNYALDLRRLSDSLRSESSCMVIVYSQKEKRLLVANDRVKQDLGWSPEKFAQNFSEVFQEGTKEWTRALGNLSSQSESRARLVLRTKSGDNVVVNCHLGLIPRGIFRNYVVGVMYLTNL